MFQPSFEELFEEELKVKQLPDDKADIARCVVRLRRSYWRDGRGIHLRMDLNFLQRQCGGYNCLEEDAANIGGEAVAERIINLYELKDGVYEVVTCNHQTDRDGCVDGYELVPLKPDETKINHP